MIYGGGGSSTASAGLAAGSAGFASAAGKIKVAQPVVDLDGDEMTRCEPLFIGVVSSAVAALLAGACTLWWRPPDAPPALRVPALRRVIWKQIKEKVRPLTRLAVPTTALPSQLSGERSSRSGPSPLRPGRRSSSRAHRRRLAPLFPAPPPCSSSSPTST